MKNKITRTIIVYEKGNRLEIKVTPLFLLRLFITIWLIILFSMPILDLYIRHSNYPEEKQMYFFYSYAICVLLLSFIFVWVLRLLQVSICLNETELTCGASKKKKWKLTDIKNITCHNKSIVIETSQAKETIINKRMGYSDKKLLLLVNYIKEKSQ